MCKYCDAGYEHYMKMLGQHNTGTRLQLEVLWVKYMHETSC